MTCMFCVGTGREPYSTASSAVVRACVLLLEAAIRSDHQIRCRSSRMDSWKETSEIFVLFSDESSHRLQSPVLFGSLFFFLPSLALPSAHQSNGAAIRNIHQDGRCSHDLFDLILPWLAEKDTFPRSTGPGTRLTRLFAMTTAPAASNPDTRAE